MGASAAGPRVEAAGGDLTVTAGGTPAVDDAADELPGVRVLDVGAHREIDGAVVLTDAEHTVRRVVGQKPPSC